MKTITLIPLTLALAVTMASTGCRHTPVKTTPLPGPPEVPMTGDAQSPTVPPAQPFNQNPPDVTSTTTPIDEHGHMATSDTWDPSDPNLTEDRATLAANTVHFAFDSAVIKTGEQANLQAVASAMSTDPNVKLMIEGNCDERGTEEYNRSLGERRALALREALVKLNVDAKRIRTISYGKDKPVDPGHTDEAFSKNRRGDFVLYHPKASA